MGNCRLIYRSRCIDPAISNAELRALVRESADNNRAAGITGMLLLAGAQFLQVLEGPCNAVNRLFMRIVKDSRHEEIELITFEEIGPRYFDDWSMSLVDLFDLPAYPRRQLAAKYPTENGIVQLPERLHEVYALLLDARHLCVGRPWEADPTLGDDPGG
jgi:hypothetical protein